MARITVTTTVHAPVEKAWAYFNQPEHIKGWAFASNDWHTPRAENDLREGGSFNNRMEAKDGSMGFDFSGVYETVRMHDFISYGLADGRKVSIQFTADGDTTIITETFDAEQENPEEMQKAGWQAMLDNFKKYAEGEIIIN